MNTHPNDPLTPEERELAQLMSRLGPTGEPSPTLDAKILAAAHSAAGREPARARKPRWPVAMGLAASVVFAVGIAWQLRPMQQVATVQEAPAAYPAVDAAQAEAKASVAIAPEGAPGAAADAAVETPPALTTPPPPPPLPEPTAETAPSIRMQTPSSSGGVSRSLPPRRSVAPAAPAQSRSADAYSPPPPPAPQAMPAPVSPPQAFASDDAAGVMADAAVATETDATRVRGPVAKQSAAHGEMKAANAAAAREQESTTLDKVAVTGSHLRRTDLQVPVSDDAQLAVGEWLERVRTRYGLGDADAARQSLLLFVKDHPGEPVPEDLEPLLDQ